MRVLDLARFAATCEAARAAFAAAQPFPHLVLDDFLAPAAAAAMVDEFAAVGDGWTHLHHVNEKKRICGAPAHLGPATRAVVDALHAPAFVAALERLTGTAGLRPDPALDGAGLAEMFTGGFLNVHRDFLTHTLAPQWRREVNLLVFLNPEWPAVWRGDLELWDAGVTRPVQTIAPRWNRCVIFRTSATSFHGVPDAIVSPADRPRRSLALYYYRDEGTALGLDPTRYVPRPGDGPLRRALIAADGLALRVYSWAKRRGWLRDATVGRFLRRL
ncbi:MAG: 2OG-Fe(II) oxygenase [bacterium]|nr:2OG-Fe(II) oxygenase [bacterium]